MPKPVRTDSVRKSGVTAHDAHFFCGEADFGYMAAIFTSSPSSIEWLPKRGDHVCYLNGRRDSPEAQHVQQRSPCSQLISPSLSTGGSRGLGLEIAKAHLRRGDHVALLARQQEGHVEAARSLGGDAPGAGRIALYAADVRDEIAVRDAISTFAREARPIERVYANAGAVESGIARATFDRGVFETNVYGVIYAVEGWLATSPPIGSNIGIIASFSAFRGLPHIPAYGASKAAVALYAESLRGRLRPGTF